jgi:hypothetical protein
VERKISWSQFLDSLESLIIRNKAIESNYRNKVETLCYELIVFYKYGGNVRKQPLIYKRLSWVNVKLPKIVTKLQLVDVVGQARLERFEP